MGKTFPSFNCAGTADTPIRINAAPNARPRLRFESLRSKPGKDTEDGNVIVQLPRPVETLDK